MKVGILTHYNVNNQGAQLQMYALYNKLIELGHSPVVLTYNKNFDFDNESKLKNQVSLRSFPYFIKNYLFAKGFGLTLHNTRKYRVNKSFRLQNFKFEDYVNANIDMAIIGSDEVFSISCGINIMMYGHGVNTQQVIAYAPSFGQTDLSQIEKYHCKNLIISGLKQFKALSARDTHTALLTQELTGIKPAIVCDPALLYDFDKTKVSVDLPKRKYLIIYSYDRHMTDEHEIQAIRAFAKKQNLITVSAGTYHKWCDKNIVCNCLEWVELFRGAEAVITDTFHGAIVSAITNVPMAIYIRNQINANKLTDLVQRLQLEDRCLKEISEESILDVFRKDLDFANLNKTITDMRKHSEQYLIDAINACANVNTEY